MRGLFSRPTASKSWAARCSTGVLAVGLALSLTVPSFADDLDDQRSALEDQISRSNANVSTYQSNLDAASQKVSATRQQLANAQAALAKAQSDRDTAQAEDAKKSAELADANANLEEGKKKVAEGQQAVKDQQAKAATDMRVAHQQNTALMSIGMLFSDNADAGDVSSRIQWAQTLYNANSSELNRLNQLQYELQNQQTELANLEDQARIAREAAAAQLATRQTAEAAADQAQAEVESLLSQSQAAEAEAASVLATEQQRNAEMQAQMDDVTARINQRNAEREAELQRQASEAAAADQSWSAAAPSDSSGSGFPLYMPADGPYTSPFAWRVNPVLGYSELHDGLDIGAGCGTPIRAASDGTVIEVGWAGGWGNRLVIDNGYVDGVQLSTGYNHAQGYIVSLGQHVSRGEVVGYIGTTGLSTGCHLHFHVWINGQVTDPEPYL